MVILARQHQQGAWRYQPENEPKKPWPEDTVVQWGVGGLVFRDEDKGGNYVTAFFEAFPKDPDTFIRGEGATVAEAEENAFAQFEKYLACPGHEFERRGYINGAGFCKHCDLFAGSIFEELPVPVDHKPSKLEKFFNTLFELDDPD